MPSNEREVERQDPLQERASNADRDDVVAQLLSAVDEGRLELSEYEDRLRSVQQAKTYGELDVVVHDLPGVVPPSRSRAELAKNADKAQRKRKRLKELKTTWVAMGSATLFFTGLWALSWIVSGGAAPYYWPAWIVGIWGIGAAVHTFRILADD